MATKKKKSISFSREKKVNTVIFDLNSQHHIKQETTELVQTNNIKVQHIKEFRAKEQHHLSSEKRKAISPWLDIR